ncbi:hypothetical protein [Humibacter albus]|jgi:hypothetical protein|uniref:hypothetical protein n=1 Tax=Humibacter albus TaxID=427754 RepID=UPI0003B64668|nr:hypothetical protein [Humibacter albus]
MSESATEYIVEYIDGPLAGNAERRVLVHGEFDKTVSAYAAVDGIESQFEYKVKDSREVQGELHVRYSFDAPDSDPYESDPEDEPGR